MFLMEGDSGVKGRSGLSVREFFENTIACSAKEGDTFGERLSVLPGQGKGEGKVMSV